MLRRQGFMLRRQKFMLPRQGDVRALLNVYPLHVMSKLCCTTRCLFAIEINFKYDPCNLTIPYEFTSICDQSRMLGASKIEFFRAVANWLMPLIKSFYVSFSNAGGACLVEAGIYVAEAEIYVAEAGRCQSFAERLPAACHVKALLHDQMSFRHRNKFQV